MFVPSAVDDGVVNAVLHHFYGTSVITKDGINGKYSSISDAKQRIKQLYQFSTFTCHNRWITEGFKGKTFNLQYSRGNGNHGSDIMADFYNGWSFSFTDWTWSTFAATFQSYLTSHARAGDPNKFRDKNGIEWPLVTFGPTLTNVLDASDNGFRLVADQKTKAEDCDFWKDALAGMTNSLGRSPER
jgi:carboxylesterase type B